jgi:VWFA-related protein
MKRIVRFVSLSLLTAGLVSSLPIFRGTAQDPAATQTTPASALPTPTPTPEPEDYSDDDVVRITTNLVQVDLVVTDSNGNQVTNLTQDDFEIFEEGKPQPITNFAFVSNEQVPAVPATVARGVNSAPATPSRVRAETARHTIAIVIDDLKMSYESVIATRKAVRKFIDERMQPGDLIAIVRTSAGIGVLQQLTSDKAQLYAATEHIRRSGDTIAERLGKACQNEFAMSLDTAVDAQSEFEGYSEQSSAYGTLGALNFIMRGLKELPGRKSVVIFSDGFIPCPQNMASQVTVQEQLRKVADLANRASAVVYYIDPRGLIPPGGAADSAGDGGHGKKTLASLSGAGDAIYNSQKFFSRVVSETGGFSVYNNNDIPGALTRVVDDQKGYYLIGYRPSDTTFAARKGVAKFTNLKVKLKRGGLTVRTRAGFYNFADTKPSSRPRTREEQLTAGLISPFSGDIDVRLTSLFGNAPTGSFVLSMLHINAAGLTFTLQPDGWQQAIMDVGGLTFDADGQVVEQVNRTQTIRAKGETFDRLMKGGLVYSLSVPVRKAGAYQLRIAVRDAATGRVGSANQFIEVPDVLKNRLTLSGIVVHESDVNSAVANSPRNPGVLAAGNNDASFEPVGSPALRRFHQNSVLEYDYVIYNASLRDGQPQLKTRISIARADEHVLDGEEKSFDVAGQADLKRLNAGGRVLLGERLPPGEYVLKIIVTDQVTKKTATQFISFEIVK